MVSVNQSNTTEILHVGTFAGHIGHRPLHVLCGGKGTAPGCAHFVGAQRYQAGYLNSYVQQNRGTTVYIPGGNRLIFSRKINIIGPSLERDIESALRGRFQDLAQDNFGTGLVHPSYYLTEPVADPSWDIRLLIPVVEDDITPVVLFKAVLSTYEGQGAIYVPPILNKQTLLAETGLDIVCGPLGELCACYHNGFQLGLIQLEIADRDFVSCWL